MKQFASLGAFAAELVAMQAAEIIALQRGLERVAVAVETTAKREIGHYQHAIGPFPSWEALSPATEDEKARLGFHLDAPLERTGEFRETYEHQVAGLEAAIGSADERAYWFEFGTSRMPPRPVLGPAALHNRERIERIIGAAAVAGLIGGSPIHSNVLGYEFETFKD